MGAGDLGEHAADPLVPDEVPDHRADVVRLVDAEDGVEHLRVAGARRQRVEPLGPILAARDPDHVALQILELVAGDQVLDGQEPVAQVALHLCVAHDPRHDGRRSRLLFERRLHGCHAASLRHVGGRVSSVTPHHDTTKWARVRAAATSWSTGSRSNAVWQRAMSPAAK